MRLCVFCGSSFGNDPAFAAAAHAIGETLVAEGIGLVYGGGRVGLMGVVADAVLAAGGEAIGVMPHALLDREIGHAGLTRLVEVASMHERKEKMAELSDGFITLPGGAGTLEEIFEQWTWAQLGIHDKPCGFLNVNGYWDPQFEMIRRAAEHGFMIPAHAAMVMLETDPADLIARFRAYEPPPPKWVSLAEQIKP